MFHHLPGKLEKLPVDPFRNPVQFWSVRRTGRLFNSHLSDIFLELKVDIYSPPLSLYTRFTLKLCIRSNQT